MMRNNNKYLSCLAKIMPAHHERFVNAGEGPEGQQEAVKSAPAAADKGADLMDQNSEANRQAAMDFRDEFRDKIQGDKLTMMYNKDGVNYRFVFKTNKDNVTVTVTKINESERQEKGQGVPPQYVKTVTYAYLYANKELVTVLEKGTAVGSAPVQAQQPQAAPAARAPVQGIPQQYPVAPGMAPPGVAGVPPQDIPVEGQAGPKNMRSVELGVSGILPQTGKETDATGGVRDSLTAGGALNWRVIVTEPRRNRPYVAIGGSLTGRYKNDTYSTAARGKEGITDTDETTVTAGVGPYVGIPLGVPEFTVTPFVGVEAVGGVRRTVTDVVNMQGVQESTATNPVGGVKVAGGVNIYPGTDRFYLTAGVERTFTNQPKPTPIQEKVQVTGGFGFTF